MCGICGVMGSFNIDNLRRVVGDMAATLRHRGPDDIGVYVSEHVGLGHTRLSIIDLSPTGHQPMFTEDGSVAIVYNGEVYNFQELRSELKNVGYHFRGTSDTEVVLNSFREWGVKAFEKLEGMFGLAIWDRTEKALYLARDKFGIKPLYYSVAPSEEIVFGSEVKALLASGLISTEMDLAGLHEYMWYGNALGKNTLFRSIKRLLPGHFLRIDGNAMTMTEFWSVSQIQPIEDNVVTASRKVLELLDQAVERHMIADVPIGVFLSGGIDSSSITALARKYCTGKLQTYSVGFDFERGINELPKAKQVADFFQTDHHELVIKGPNLPHVIEDLVSSHDEPFADAANIPLYLMCKKLQDSLKVVLQGDGGDEIFAGYRRYNTVAFQFLLRVFGRLGASIYLLVPDSQIRRRLKRIVEAILNNNRAIGYALLLSPDTLTDPPTQILSLELQSNLQSSDPFARYIEIFDDLSNLDSVQRALYTDCKILLPDTYLEKVDKSTMAHGIEIRVPFLDNKLTEYVMGLASDLKVHRLSKKWILKRAMRGTVPDFVLDGPKTGFSVPYQYWLRGPLSEYLRSVLLDRRVERPNIFDKPKLEKMIKEHIDGTIDHGNILWKCLNLALWHSKYMIN